jgi:hypothetical protein
VRHRVLEEKLGGKWTEYRQKAMRVKTLPVTKFEVIAYVELSSHFCPYVLITTGLYRVFQFLSGAARRRADDIVAAQ